MKFEELRNVLDAYIRVEVYDYKGELKYNGRLLDLKDDVINTVLRVDAQRTNKDLYLEIVGY